MEFTTIKVTGINGKILENEGFTYSKNGYYKEIPGCFRFAWFLYITDDDIYGTIEGKMGNDEVLDIDDWINRMAFRSPNKAEETKKLIERLIRIGAVEAETK